MATNGIHLEADFTLLRSQFAGIRKRDATRYKCGLATLGHLTLPEGGPRKEVWAANLSETGIGFSFDQPLEPGTTLIISLSGHKKETVTMQAKVAHSTQEPDCWMIGCEFAERLKPETLDDLL